MHIHSIYSFIPEDTLITPQDLNIYKALKGKINIYSSIKPNCTTALGEGNHPRHVELIGIGEIFIELVKKTPNLYFS